jgi:integrase
MSVQRERVELGIWRRYTDAGSPVYEIVYRDSDGRVRRRTVPGGVREARTALADIRSDKGHGKRVAPAPRLTFAIAAERWLEAQTGTLRPATLDAYGSHLRSTLLPRWGRTRLDAITVDDVCRLAESMRRAGRKAWTIRGALVVVSRVFAFAERRLGWAGQNPVKALDRSERPRSDQRERRVLSSDELDAVLDASNGVYRSAVLIAAMTGARLGEVLGLHWRDVDLDAGTASIRGQLDRHGELVPTKTARSHRTIDLPGALVAELRRHKLSESACGSDDLVLTTPRSRRGLDHRTVTRAFADAVKRAEIETPAPTFHSLRHTFASRFIASGGDLVSLSAHLGHGSPAITASCYSHEFERAQRGDERRKRLDAMFGGNTDGNAMATPQCNRAQQTDADVLDLQAMRAHA